MDNLKNIKVTVWFFPDGFENRQLNFFESKEPSYQQKTFKDFEALETWCETRQPPRTRIGIDELLRTVYKMKVYLPIQMCRKSHGITHEDDLWMLFNNEEVIKYETLSVR